MMTEVIITLKCATGIAGADLCVDFELGARRQSQWHTVFNRQIDIQSPMLDYSAS